MTSEPVQEEEFVILVAVNVTARNKMLAHQKVHALMPNPDVTDVESWWVAEDQRWDGSDNDSAVFVNVGAQKQASHLLYGVGLSNACNLVTR